MRAMSRFRSLLALVSAPFDRRTTKSLTVWPTTLIASFALRASCAILASFALLAFHTSIAEAQGRPASDTPLHVPANRFEFIASGEAPPSGKLLAVHNGGTSRLTNVRLTRLAYADSARGVAWLVVAPRQPTVAPDELATVGTLCVNTSGLKAGTYKATAAVGAREVAEPVSITISLVVTEAGARARYAPAGCGPADAK